MIGAINGGGAAAPQGLIFKDITLSGAGFWKHFTHETKATKVIGYKIYNSSSEGKLCSACFLPQCFIAYGKLEIAVTNSDIANRSAKVDVEVFVE